MNAMIISRSTAWSALDNNKHVVRNQPVIGVEGKPRRASSPAAALAARSEHVVERGRALGRAVCEAFRPMCACELSVSMLKTEVAAVLHEHRSSERVKLEGRIFTCNLTFAQVGRVCGSENPPYERVLRFVKRLRCSMQP